MGTKSAVVMLIIACILLQVSGCEWSSELARGLYLPRGNAEQGRLAFIELQCHRCHTVTGVTLPAVPNETPMIAFNIGGVGSRVKTYSELVTAIINPMHITSPDYIESLGELAAAGKVESPMPSFNEQMTVAQLIDIVMFLNARYEDLFLEYLGHSYATD
jgi:hypothetical protein